MNASEHFTASWRAHWPWALLAATFIWLLWLLQPILMPFLVGAGLAYVGDPLVRRLQNFGFSRDGSVTMVFVTLSGVSILLALWLLPILILQIEQFVIRLPDYVARIQTDFWPKLEALVGLESPEREPAKLQELIRKHWAQAQDVLGTGLLYLTRSSADLVTTFASLLLVPVVTFYLLRDWQRLLDSMRKLLPRSVEPRVLHVVRDADGMLGEFFRGQLIVMMSLGAMYSIGLWMIGLDFALLIGLIAGLVSFVPYLGPIVGVLTASIAMWLQTHMMVDLLWVGMIFGIGQMVEGMLLTPLLVGDRIGLHPVAVIFAIMAGGQLFGFVGVLLGLPIAAVVVVVLRHLHEEYVVSDTYLAQPNSLQISEGFDKNPAASDEKDEA